VPHLTVGHETPFDQLRSAESELTEMPTLHGRATSVTLLVQPDPGRPVQIREEFRLG
jgi:hypothetical protein